MHVINVSIFYACFVCLFVMHRTSFLATFVPMSYLIFKCLFVFIRQRKKLLNANRPPLPTAPATALALSTATATGTTTPAIATSLKSATQSQNDIDINNNNSNEEEEEINTANYRSAKMINNRDDSDDEDTDGTSAGDGAIDGGDDDNKPVNTRNYAGKNLHVHHGHHQPADSVSVSDIENSNNSNDIDTTPTTPKTVEIAEMASVTTSAAVAGTANSNLTSISNSNNKTTVLINNQSMSQRSQTSQASQRQRKNNAKQQLYSPDRNKMVDNIAQAILICISFIYLIFGIGFSILVFTHFENSQQECSNPDSNIVEISLQQHPELYFWDQCDFKTFPFKSVDFWSTNSNDENNVNCNCREVQIDLSLFTDTEIARNSTSDIVTGCDTVNNLCLMFESMLINWNMLETIFITDGNDNTVKAAIDISLNFSVHYNAVHLKILHLDAVNVNILGESISKWKNLEYLYISHTHFTNWPQAFNKLNKLSFLRLDDSYLSNLPSNINLCSMKNLRGINIEQSLTGLASNEYITHLPDCNVNLDQLQSVIIHYGNMISFPYGLLSMSSIEEIGFMFDTQFGVIEFLDIFNSSLNNDNDGMFTWNNANKTEYSFSGSNVCNEMTNFDIAGFSNEYDDLENIDLLKESSNSTGVCEVLCGIHTVHVFICPPFKWQNGVCDGDCDFEACNYDGGDCNQLCQIKSPDCYSLSLFNNGVCEEACNITECDFDQYECVTTPLDIQFPTNMSYCNIDEIMSSSTDSDVNTTYDIDTTTGLCHVSWVDDKICDNTCVKSENCFYDAYDCECDQETSSQGYCQVLVDAYLYFGAIEDSKTGVKYNHNGWCTVWTLIASYNSRGNGDVEDRSDQLSLQLESGQGGMERSTDWEDQQDEIIEAFWEYYNQYTNCTLAFENLDTNQDNFVDINEMFQEFFEAFNLTDNKASQINCSYAIYC